MILINRSIFLHKHTLLIWNNQHRYNHCVERIKEISDDVGFSNAYHNHVLIAIKRVSTAWACVRLCEIWVYGKLCTDSCITMTSQWVGRRLKSPASRLFTQPFIRAQIKENIKAPHHWPLCGEFTGDRWIPRTNGQQSEKCFHLMTSSCFATTAGGCWCNMWNLYAGCGRVRPHDGRDLMAPRCYPNQSWLTVKSLI